MSNISLVEATLPPGFRFHPRDEELICDYLLNKFSLSDSPLLVQIDLNKCEPWDLPETAHVGGKEWYFYSRRDRKYATGLRTNRATMSGYWKATGKDRSIFRNRTLVGMRKTLVFYLGRAPKGKKSNWVMHEFRQEGPQTPPVDSSLKDDLVLCRVFCKNTETETVDEKQNNNNMGSINKNVRHGDRIRCSSSLPPLMEPHTLSLNQNQHTNKYIRSSMFNRQVPCFSTIFNQCNPQFDLTKNDHQVFSTIVPPPPQQPSDFIITSSDSSSLSHCSDNKDVIKDILYRFDNMDEVNNSSDTMFSFDEGNVDQNFLSDVDLPVTMWYP